ncbi:polysaccharide biosynthesis/export family protein [Fodinibius sp. AD559]|uniref:polysaccharide biosynthesis/export family protein n=1 Tax=Fodinibius sp. AD559 TaxID=3424179 RepID=UPI004046EB1A
MNFKLLSILTVSILITGCSSSKQFQEETTRKQITESKITTSVEDPLYKIRPGDEVELLVWEQPNFNTTTAVSNMGTIAVPLLGEINVSGMTHEQLKRELTDRLGQYIKGETNLTLSIRSTQQMMVSVFGMVSRPDNYPVVEEASIFRVLSMAGGPTEEANIRNVKVYRKSSTSNYATLDLTRYLDNGQLAEQAALVYPGDIIYVPQKQNAVREMSDFFRDVVLLFGIFRVVN